MSIRITTQCGSDETVVAIDGRLRSEDIGELHAECYGVDESLVLDLTNLQTVDAAGLGILIHLIQQGARTRGASPYIDLLLSSKW